MPLQAGLALLRHRLDATLQRANLTSPHAFKLCKMTPYVSSQIQTGTEVRRLTRHSVHCLHFSQIFCIVVAPTCHLGEVIEPDHSRFGLWDVRDSSSTSRLFDVDSSSTTTSHDEKKDEEHDETSTERFARVSERETTQQLEQLRSLKPHPAPLQRSRQSRPLVELSRLSANDHPSQSSQAASGRLDTSPSFFGEMVKVVTGSEYTSLTDEGSRDNESPEIADQNEPSPGVGEALPLIRQIEVRFT
jgi:hypothetical protein